MKRRKKNLAAGDRLKMNNFEKGSALIIVILVLAFLLVVGLAVIAVTNTGTVVAGNIRTQQQAFNAAEAGFDSAWLAIENSFATDSWVSFDSHYLKEPSGIDDPLSVYYFRKMRDREMLDYIDPDGDGNPDVANVIFCRQPYISDGGVLDHRFTYTAFLIDDEAGGGTPDAGDTLLVCIGSIGTGSNMTTTRLEIELAIEISH